MIIKINWKKTILFLFSISILFPTGFGIRIDPSYPGLDIQRLSILFIFIIFPIYCFKKSKLQSKILIHTKIELFLLFIIFIMFISIITVDSPWGALLWAFGNKFLYFGYSFIIIFILANERIELIEFTKTVSIISIVLIIWVMLETILQTNIITYRNMYDPEIVNLFSNLTRIWVMPIGPYVYVKALAMALILFGPMAYIYKKRNGGRYAIVWLLLFVLSVLSVQTISALFALCIMFFLSLFYYSKRGALISLIGISTLIFLIYIITPSDIIQELNTSPNSKVCCSAVDYYFDYYLFDHPRSSIYTRLSHLGLLFTDWLENDRWLFGWGSGSMVDPARVNSSIFKKYHEANIYPGSFFIWFLELGIFVGTLIFFIFLRAIMIGLNSRDNVLILFAISLSGFFIMMLSTVNTNVFGPALVIAGLIEYFSKKRNLKLKKDIL